jgi:hypothetical protein
MRSHRMVGGMEASVSPPKVGVNVQAKSSVISLKRFHRRIRGRFVVKVEDTGKTYNQGEDVDSDFNTIWKHVKLLAGERDITFIFVIGNLQKNQPFNRWIQGKRYELGNSVFAFKNITTSLDDISDHIKIWGNTPFKARVVEVNNAEVGTNISSELSVSYGSSDLQGETLGGIAKIVYRTMDEQLVAADAKIVSRTMDEQVAADAKATVEGSDHIIDIVISTDADAEADAYWSEQRTDDIESLGS